MKTLETTIAILVVLTGSLAVLADDGETSSGSAKKKGAESAGKPNAQDAAAAQQLTQQGWQLWQKGQATEAIEKFNEAIKLAPNNEATLNGLGWASFNSGKLPEAQKAFERLIKLNPRHAAALNGMGQLYLAQAKYVEAEAYLLKASAKSSAAWYGLARIYLLQGKFDKAEKWAQKLVSSGEADDTAKQMFEAAKAKELSDDLRAAIEPRPQTSAAAGKTEAESK